MFRIITGKTSLTDRVAFWTRRSSFLTDKQSDENSKPKTEEIGVFRRQGSVRDMARQFGAKKSESNFQRNAPARKSWCVNTKPLTAQEPPSPKIRSRVSSVKSDENEKPTDPKPVPKRRQSIDRSDDPVKVAPVPKIRASLLQDQTQKVRVRKKKTQPEISAPNNVSKHLALRTLLSITARPETLEFYVCIIHRVFILTRDRVSKRTNPHFRSLW